MNVEELQLHLTNLSQLLRSAGGKKTADELDKFCADLQQYRVWKLTDLMQQIVRAEKILATGPSPTRPRTTRSKSLDPQELVRITDKIGDIYNLAGTVTVSYDDINTALAELEKLNLTVDQLKTVAARLNITQKLTKPKLFERIRQVILERKGMAERVNI